jgi:hypothetical protein
MAQYKVLSNLDHDDQSYKIGDVVDGSVLGDAAQGLVADGVIESLGLPVEIPTETEQSEEVASVTEAVAEAPATPAPLEETSAYHQASRKRQFQNSHHQFRNSQQQNKYSKTCKAWKHRPNHQTIYI